MRTNNLLKNSIKIITRNKRYMFYTILNVICLSITMVCLSVSSTYNKVVSDNVTNNPLINMISIDFDGEDTDISDEKIDEILEKIKNIDHVDDIIYQGYFNGGGTVVNDENDISMIVDLKPLPNNSTLPNQSTTEELKLNEIIIPEKFTYYQYDMTDSDLDESIFIDGKSLIGETITIYYTVTNCETGEDVETRYIDLKVVGTYDSTTTGFPGYYSFTSVETIAQEELLINITDECKIDRMYYIHVDNEENLNSVKSKISKMGYATGDGPVYVRDELYDKYVSSMITISVTSLLFLLIFKMVFFRKLLNDNEKNLFVNSICGYNKFDLINEEITKNVLVEIISIIILSIILYIIMIYYNNNFEYLILAGYNVTYPYIKLILLALFLFIFDSIISIIYIKTKDVEHVEY